jgi:hypothetical protein
MEELGNRYFCAKNKYCQTIINVHCHILYKYNSINTIIIYYIYVILNMIMRIYNNLNNDKKIVIINNNKRILAI